MWKCMRCEKENQDTAETCIGFGHGRTMEYLQHRTLTKLPWSLAAHWKTSNRKEAEEFVQNKLVSLGSSVNYEKEKIADKQKELDELNRTVRKHNKTIEKKKKNDKVWESITDIFPKICVIGVALLWCYIFYVIMFVEKVTEGVDLGEIIYAGVIYIYFSLICAWFCSRVLIYVGLVVIAIIEVLVEAIMGIVNDEKLKQISAERDCIQHSIDEKTEELAAVQSELSSLEQRIQRIEENRETTINKLSQVSPQRMEAAWRRQSLGW